MKKYFTIILTLALVLAAVCIPSFALAANGAPSGSGNELFANGTPITIDTKANMVNQINPATPTNVHIASATNAEWKSFSQGTENDAATVAYWQMSNIVYYAVLKDVTTVYAGGSTGSFAGTSVVMNEGKVGTLVAGGKAGSTSNASVAVKGGAVGKAATGGGTVKGANITVSGGAVTSVSLGGAGTVSGDVKLTVTGAEKPTTVSLETGLAAADVSLSVPNGAIQVRNVDLKSLTIAAGTTVTIPASATLRASGMVSVNGTLRNSGAISGPVKIAANGTLESAGGSISGELNNAGSVTLTDGKLPANTVVNTGGTMMAGGAALTISNGQTLTIQGGTVGAAAAAVDNQGALNVAGGTLTGSKIANNGAMAFSSGGVTGPIQNAAQKTIKVTGGSLGAEVNNLGTLEISGGGVSGKVVNSGIVSLMNNGALQGDVENQKTGSIMGTLSIPKGKTLTNAGALSAPLITVNGTLNNDVGGSVGGSVPAAVELINLGTVNNAGAIAAEIDNRSNGKIFNAGAISGTPLTNAGALTNQNKGTVSSAAVANSGSFVNENGGNVTNASTITNTGTLNNAGTMAAAVKNEKGATLTNSKDLSGAVANASGATLTNSGAVSGAVTNAGDLTNNGTISGKLDNQSGGSVANGGKITGGVSNKGTIRNTSESASVTGKVTGTPVVEFEGTITASNANGSITLSDMPMGSVLTTTPLATSSATFKTLKEAVGKGKILCAYEITCNKTFTGTKTLTFNLGKDYAGKTISGLHYANGIVGKHVAKADGSGRFSMPVSSLSPFMLATGADSTVTAKPPKTGGMVEAGPACALILLSAGLYAWRKRRA